MRVNGVTTNVHPIGDPFELYSRRESLEINGKRYPIQGSSNSSDIRPLKREIHLLNESQKELLSSLLAIKSNLAKGPLDRYDICDALRSIRELDNNEAIETTIDVESNTIRMQIPGWEFQAQADALIGTFPFRGTLKTLDDSFHCSFNTANASYARMRELMQKLSHLNQSDQKKLIETLNNPSNAGAIIYAIDALAAPQEGVELPVELPMPEGHNHVPLSDVNEYTNRHFSFSVYDWDWNRGQPPAGEYLVGKVSFYSEDVSSGIVAGKTFGKNSLQGCTVEEIASLFHTILNSFNARDIQGKTFSATSVHLRLDAQDTIPHKPFLFIMGNPIDQQVT